MWVIFISIYPLAFKTDKNVKYIFNYPVKIIIGMLHVNMNNVFIKK